MTRGLAEGLIGLRGLVLANLLGPTAFGAWALYRLSLRYASLASLGLFRGMELKLLEPRGPGQVGERPEAGTVLGFTLVVTVALASVALGISFVVRDAQQVLVLRGFAAAVVLEQVYAYAMVWTRVRTTLRRYASLEVAHAVLQASIGIALGARWGLAGAFTGVAVASTLGILLAAHWVEFHPRLRVDVLRRLLAIGFPLVLSVILTGTLSTADRWVVAVIGGATMLGYYAFAASIAGVASSFAIVVRTVVMPDVYGEAGRAGPVTALRRHLDRTVLPFARLYPPLLGVGACLLGPALALVMPKYLPAAAPARLFLLGAAAAGLVGLASMGVVAAGRQRRLPAISATVLVGSVALSVLALEAGAGLEVVAAVSFLVQVAYAGAVLRLNLREGGVVGERDYLIQLLLPLLWCTAAAVAAGHLAPSDTPLRMGLAVPIYLALMIPAVPGIVREWRRVRGAGPRRLTGRADAR